MSYVSPSATGADAAVSTPNIVVNASESPRFWKIFLKDVFLVVLGVTLFCFLFATFAAIVVSQVNFETDDLGFDSVYVSGNESATRKIVVLPLEGEIATDPTGFFAKAIKNLEEDDELAAVVLRVDSPGGTISGSDYDLYLLKELKKKRNIPIIVSMGDLAASGGYYASTVGDKIFAERSTMTGSIGVIVPMYNAASLCEKLGVRSSAITSGPMKGMGDFMKEPTEEETAIWQGMVDESYEQFLSVIREGRPYYREEGRDAELRKLADGRIYTATQALDLHLIDEIGFLDDAITAAINQAGLTTESCYVVRYEETEDLLTALGLGVKAKKEPLNKAIDAVSTPKGYYLCPRALPL